MAEYVRKLAAIFQNRQSLKHALDTLNAFGFQREDLSLLLKHQPAEALAAQSPEVLTYSSALYPPLARSEQPLADAISSPRELAADETAQAPIRNLLQNPLEAGLLGLSAGTQALIVPGMGPVLAAGPLAAGIAAWPAGTEADNTALRSLLQAEGIPAAKLETYCEAFAADKGILLLGLINESEFTVVRELLERYHPERLELL